MLSALLLAVALTAEPVVRGKDAPRYPIGDKGFATLFWNAQNGSPNVSVGQLELKAGATVAEHDHGAAAEYLVVKQGVCELTTGGQTVVVKAGDAVFLPAGQKHSAKIPADAKEPFVAVQLYAPAGPEQRFVKPPPDAGVK
ncbi:MAG: cupin domain-containing protein [Myxococcaceae bacterium]|nr:cupin domain-containing protein [Myxococcaceae bacterium]